MKRNLTRIMGIGFALVLIASLMVFALPTSADPYEDVFAPVPNMWKAYESTEGAAGGWFYDPDIEVLGPIAEAINGDLYLYVAGTSATAATSGTDDIFKSTDGGRTWSVSTVPDYYTGEAVVDMVCSELSEDIIYLTDGNYVYKSVDGATSFSKLAEESLESVLMGECGMTITNYPITCIDVGYDSSDQPIVFIGTRFAWHVFPADHATFPLDLIVGSVYYIEDGAFASDWTDLQLKCYGCCDPTTCGTTAVTAYDTGYDISIGSSTVSGWLNNHVIVPDTVTIYDNFTYETFTDNGDGTLTGDNGGSGTVDYATGYFTLTFGSAAATTQDIIAAYSYSDIDDGYSLCSCGCFDVYAVGCAPDFATSSKVYALITTDEYDCDDTVDADGYSSQHFGDPATRVVSTTGTICNWSDVAELYWDCDDVTPNNFSVNHASRFAFPDDYADTGAMFIGVASSTYDSYYGVLVGGDVYRVDDTTPATAALDLNVRGYLSGCVGLYHANICSLDIEGDTDDCSLIAGAWDDNDDQIPTEVYYSTDGGWTWDDSDKDPTGVDHVYTIWHEDTALATTRWCDCAVSMACGDEVGKYWNQISLLNVCIETVVDLSHSPGYGDTSETMYVLTMCGDSCERSGYQPSSSLFRWDGSYWERVYSSLSYEYATRLDWVEVSPDFNDTSCVYVANTAFGMLRSLDAGCSWRAISYPCAPTPQISAWIVVDEETVLAAGAGSDAGTIYKTERHGSRPWDEITVFDALGAVATCDGVDFDLSPSIATDSSVLFGNACGEVYLSQDVGDSWDEIEDFIGHDFADQSDETYVVFDPGYGTAGDPGETTVYAAAGSYIGRCAIDSEALFSKQDWLYLSTATGDCEPCTLCVASGIDAAGDTTLYVADAGYYNESSAYTQVSGTIEVDCEVNTTCEGCSHDLTISSATVTVVGSVAFTDDEPVQVESWNITCELECIDDTVDYCQCTLTGEIWLRGSISGAYGYITVYHVETLDCACDAAEPGGDCEGYSNATVVSSFLQAYVYEGSSSCPTGVWRTVNPLDVIDETTGLNLVEFQFLDYGLYGSSSLIHPPALPSSVNPDNLWLTSGSNVLWALDDGYWTYVWVWDDPLATQVTLVSPSNGTALATPTTAALEWEALDGATSYQVYLYSYCAACPDQKVLEDTFYTDETCLSLSDLVPGTTYYWKVRVACDSPEVSKWSDLWSFDTALTAVPDLCSPACGAEDVILTTNFSWDEVAGAVSYEVQIATDEDFANIVDEATTSVNAWVSSVELDYSTTYYWRVRAVGANATSAWSVCIFTTEDEPVTPVEETYELVQTTEEITPTWIWVIIGIGGALTIAVIILIVTTRRVP